MNANSRDIQLWPGSTESKRGESEKLNETGNLIKIETSQGYCSSTSESHQGLNETSTSPYASTSAMESDAMEEPYNNSCFDLDLIEPSLSFVDATKVEDFFVLEGRKRGRRPGFRGKRKYLDSGRLGHRNGLKISNVMSLINNMQEEGHNHTTHIIRPLPSREPSTSTMTRLESKADHSLKKLELLMKMARDQNELVITAVAKGVRVQWPVPISEEGKCLLKKIIAKSECIEASSLHKNALPFSLHKKFNFEDLKSDLFKNFFVASPIMNVSDNLMINTLMRFSLLAPSGGENDTFGELDRIMGSWLRRKQKNKRAIRTRLHLTDAILALTNIFSVQEYSVTGDKFVTQPNNETFRDGATFLMSSMIRAFDIPTQCGEVKESCCGLHGCLGCCLIHIKHCKKLDSLKKY